MQGEAYDTLICVFSNCLLAMRLQKSPEVLLAYIIAVGAGPANYFKADQVKLYTFALQLKLIFDSLIRITGGQHDLLFNQLQWGMIVYILQQFGSIKNAQKTKF